MGNLQCCSGKSGIWIEARFEVQGQGIALYILVKYISLVCGQQETVHREQSVLDATAYRYKLSAIAPDGMSSVRLSENP